MLTAQTLQEILDCIAVKTGDNSGFLSSRTVGGGSINNAYCLRTKHNTYFVKLNDALRFPGMFEAESMGLRLLSTQGGPNVPEVIGTGSLGNNSYIVMNWLEPGKRKVDYFETFGRALVELHGNSQNSFGLDHDNYIGSLQQSNRKHVSGSEFFIAERLLPQAEAAFASGVLPSAAAKDLESLLKIIPSLLPDEKPALLHGDLWNGNVVTGPDGNAWLIDPAAYYGYRESDIAMTMLFGGFDETFYKAYQEAFPFTGDWKSRIDIFNLYPLLVHVNLFGGGYVTQVMQILSRYK